MTVLLTLLSSLFLRLFDIFFAFCRWGIVRLAIELGSLQDVIAVLHVVIGVVAILLEVYLRRGHVGLGHAYQLRVVLRVKSQSLVCIDILF